MNSYKNFIFKYFLLVLIGSILSACSGDSGGLPEAAPSDKVGPVVLEITPVSNELDVPADITRITIKFDEKLDKERFFPSNVIIQAIDTTTGLVIPGTNITASPPLFRESRNELTIRFASGSLLEETLYQIVLQEFEDINGNVMSVYKSTFSTSTPPTATIKPNDGAKPVSRSAAIVVEFSEIVDESSLKIGFTLIETLSNPAATRTYKFNQNNAPSPLQLTHQIVNNKSIATYSLFDVNQQTTALFAKTAKYTIKLSSSLIESISDLKGNPLAPLTSTFSTGVSDQVGTAPAQPGTITAKFQMSGGAFSNTVSWPTRQSIAYNLYVSINGSTYSQKVLPVATAGSAGLEFVDKNVIVGSKYIYAVTAMNVLSTNPNVYGPESAYSVSQEVIPSVAAPNSLTAVAGPNGLITDSTIEITWDSVIDSKYFIYVSTGGAFTKLTPAITASAVQTKKTYTPGDDVFYQYGITVVNSNNKESSMTKSNKVIPFGAPVSVTATAGNEQATVNWPVWLNVPGLSYTVFAKEGVAAYTMVASGLTLGSYTHGKVTKLIAGTQYTYKIVAVSTVSGTPIRTSLQSLASNTVIPVTVAALPTTPTNVSAIAGDGNITLSWDVAVGKNYEYRIYQKKATAASYVLIKKLLTGSATIAALNNVNYTYQIAAFSVNVESVRVTTAQLTPRKTGDKISAWSHSCVIKSGALSCWGLNNVGQLGNGSTSAADKPVRVAAVATGTSWVAVSTGKNHTCGIRNTGEMYCWGFGRYGQLGNAALETDSLKTRTTPVLVDSPTLGLKVDAANPRLNWTQVVAGFDYTCGIHKNALATGQLFCWGDNRSGGLGITELTSGFKYEFVPQPILLGTDPDNNWLEVQASAVHLCGIRQQLNESTLWCWGYGQNGQLGNGSTTSNNIPSKVMSTIGAAIPDTDWSSVAVGRNHTCGVRATNALYCWGTNNLGQFGNPRTPATPFAPVREASSATDWLKVFAHKFQTCGLKTSGVISCWGENDTGEAGNGRLAEIGEIQPTIVSGAADWSVLAIGEEHTCAINNLASITPGGVSCWGSAERYAIGSITSETATPIQVGLASDWLDITSGIRASKEFTLGLRGTTVNNDMYGWGSNEQAALGIGQLSVFAIQKPMIEINNTVSTWNEISAGAYHSCGIKDDKFLYCWGNRNYLGQASSKTATPTKVGVEQWLHVDAGVAHSCGIKLDNTLWCWGLGNYGELGAGVDTTGKPIVPNTANGIYMIQVIDPKASASPPSVTTWISVSAGSRFTCAIDSLSDLYCWGENRFGQLGLGDKISQYVPTNVTAPLGVTWSKVSTGYSTTCGVTNNGNQNLYCWGSNGVGQVGVDLSTATLSPTVVTTVSSTASGFPWVDISINAYHTCARKNDGITGQGSLWCWGGNEYGQAGNGNFDYFYSSFQYLPTQVSAGTEWKNFSAGLDSTCAIKSDNSLWCWGRNFAGQLGTDNAWREIPTALTIP